MTDQRFSALGKPASEFEHDLLANSEELEDVWVEISGIVGIDHAMAIMDRFSGCLLSVPKRSDFVKRMYRVFVDREVLRLRKHRPRMSNAEISTTLGVSERSIRRRLSRVLRRGPVGGC